MWLFGVFFPSQKNRGYHAVGSLDYVSVLSTILNFLLTGSYISGTPFWNCRGCLFLVRRDLFHLCQSCQCEGLTVGRDTQYRDWSFWGLNWISAADDPFQCLPALCSLWDFCSVLSPVAPTLFQTLQRLALHTCRPAVLQRLAVDSPMSSPAPCLTNSSHFSSPQTLILPPRFRRTAALCLDFSSLYWGAETIPGHSSVPLGCCQETAE